VSMRRVVVRGHTLIVEDRGDGDVVVLLHGFTGDTSSMAGLAERVSQGRRAIIPDLIGHGGSAEVTDPAAFEFTESAELVAEVVAELSPDRFDLIGYSMGGRLALQLAVAHPERVRSVSLIGAAPGIAEEAERSTRVDLDAALADQIESGGVEAFVDHWERLPLFATQASLPDEVRQTIRAQRLGNSAAGLALSLRGSGTGSMAPLHDVLADIETPMCWITGALDTKFTEIAAQVCSTNHRFEQVTITDAGHATHLEAPDAVAEAIRSFWATAA
jgi:2-succinyl-6-hydroxy-2,4-cyclohexadiene-1-carboxylate synthase